MSRAQRRQEAQGPGPWSNSGQSGASTEQTHKPEALGGVVPTPGSTEWGVESAQGHDYSSHTRMGSQWVRDTQRAQDGTLAAPPRDPAPYCTGRTVLACWRHMSAY